MGGSTTTRFLLLLSTAATPSPLLRRYPSLLRYVPRHLPLRLISSYSSPSQSHTQPISSSWPEWSHLLHSLSSSGYFPSEPEEHPTHPLSIDLSASSPPLPPDFLRVASACFAFSRARSHILWMLPRRDIEVVVQHGVPFLFKGCDESVRRMKLFLAGNEQNAEGADVAVDLMKYLLSYVSGVSSEGNNCHNAELVEPSVRNLLREMCHLSYFNDNSQRSNIEMKRGDWICPRCQFMNFARNVKCLECEEPRPRKQLTGREWECPQCDFLNFGRNVVCLRCDCKRPSDSVHGVTNSGSGFGRGDGNHGSKADADGISATNEEKAQRWFSKLSQLHSSSPGVSSDIADGNFPEMMPLRKSVNRKGVAFEQANNSKYVPFVPFPPGYFARKDDQQQDNKATGETSLSEIPGKFTDTTPGVSHNPNAPVMENQQLGTTHEPRSGNSTQNVIDPRHGGSNSRRGQYSSFDTTSEMLNLEGDSQQNLSARQRGGLDNSSGYPGKQNSNETGNFSSPQPSVKSGIAANWTGKSLEGSQVKEPDPLDMSEEAKAERWFRRVAQIKDISELSQIPDEDFPSIMPMRKGVNRFVVSKRKTPLERRLTSTQCRRNLPVVSSDPVKENDSS